MIWRPVSFASACVLVLAQGLLLAPPVIAGVPLPAALPWESISKTLNDPALPLSWHDARGNSIVYYHLHFGSERDAVTVLKRARLKRVELRDRRSLAYFSAVNGKEFALRELLADGVSANAEFSGESLLMAAAREEQLGIIRLLTASGADVNYRCRSPINPEQWSDAASYALNAGKYNAFRLLLSSGYAMSKDDPAQRSELLFAAIGGGSATAVSYVLDNFSSVNALNSDGDTPLTFAVRTEAADAVVSELLLRGADPCKRNKENASVADLLHTVNKDKKSYEARFTLLRDRLICKPSDS